jgi:hypothetical protein
VTALYLDGVIRKLAATVEPGRNRALNGAAWTLARWVAAGVLDQREVEDALYAATEANGLVTEDGPTPVLGHDPQQAQRRPAGPDRPRSRSSVLQDADRDVIADEFQGLRTASAERQLLPPR